MAINARFLAAEDDPTSAVALKAVLKHLGYETDLARDGGEAVDMWERGGYDLILMDVKMPTLDGVEAARQIREKERRNGEARIPIVALTATTFPEEKERYLRAGIDACLGKPFDVERGNRVLRRLLGYC